ncbi:MAG: tryptophan synthase subunit alpha [Methanoregulaceae archaeon]|nr:tryptophan synthase subunit alpha [Methanoregulaceae archaeon]MCU0628858.1 tryptophan synthase subunit alpha [Methanoregulaceae archaeon]
MSSRITGAFCAAGRPLLVACTVAGDPSFDESISIIRELVCSGTDIIEIVMPFSDPVADGPVIQQAGARALASGMNTDRLFELIREVRKETEIPLLIMTYANIVVQRGIEEFYRDAARAGADGIVVADVPLEEADPFCAAAGSAGIDPILFVSQTTSPERIEKILSKASGFVYLVAVMGVTGTREEISPEAIALLKTVKERTSLPVVPGFGISTPEHVRRYAQAGADGVIIGSALVRIVGEYTSRKAGAESGIGALVKGLKISAHEN